MKYINLDMQMFTVCSVCTDPLLNNQLTICQYSTMLDPTMFSSLCVLVLELVAASGNTFWYPACEAIIMHMSSRLVQARCWAGAKHLAQLL